MVYGNFIGREKYQTTETLDGGKFSGVPWVSGLIEGRGRMYDTKTGKLDSCRFSSASYSFSCFVNEFRKLALASNVFYIHFMKI